MTFAYFEPVFLDLKNVNIQNEYNPETDKADVSASFPASPDVALRLYAQNRFRSGGEKGQLSFVIEEARVHHGITEADDQFSRWLKRNRKETYDVFVKIRLDSSQPSGALSSVLSVQKSLSLPESVSLAERELMQMTFLEELVKDVDAAVMDSLQKNHKLYARAQPEEATVPMTSKLLTSPEVR